MILLKKMYSFIDSIFEKFTLLSLVLLVFIVTLQVITRNFLTLSFFGQKRSLYFC